MDDALTVKLCRIEGNFNFTELSIRYPVALEERRKKMLNLGIWEK